jgi:hypothetical protein
MAGQQNPCAGELYWGMVARSRFSWIFPEKSKSLEKPALLSINIVALTPIGAIAPIGDNANQPASSQMEVQQSLIEQELPPRMAQHSYR